MPENGEAVLTLDDLSRAEEVRMGHAAPPRQPRFHKSVGTSGFPVSSLIAASFLQNRIHSSEPLTPRIQEKYIHRVFQISLILKGLNALLETLAGILLLFTATVNRLVTFLTERELLEDPRDIVANYLQHLVQHTSVGSEHFAAFYLLSHGILKGFLVIGLLRNKLWVYPAAIVVFALFIVYQILRYSLTHSFFLIFLTVFDLFVIWLTWHEYRYLKTHRHRR